MDPSLKTVSRKNGVLEQPVKETGCRELTVSSAIYGSEGDDPSQDSAPSDKCPPPPRHSIVLPTKRTATWRYSAIVTAQRGAYCRDKVSAPGFSRSRLRSQTDPLQTLAGWFSFPSMRTAFILAPLALFGCAQASRPSPPDEVQAAVHKCGMDGQLVFKKEGPREYSVQHVAEEANSNGFLCVMKELDGRGIRVGFISEPKPQP